jgi:hypothetical protein
MTVLAMLMLSVDGQSQSDELPRRELGIHFTIIDLNEVFEIPGGFGGRFTYNITRNLAIDSEVNHFPRKNPTRRVLGGGFGFETPENALPFGETQALIGLKAGARIDKFGLFAKARPGAIHFRRRQISDDFDDQSRTKFSLDIGGVFEYYPIRELALRIDLGDTIIPFGGRTIRTSTETVRFDTGLHNLQGGIGLSLRF